MESLLQLWPRIRAKVLTLILSRQFAKMGAGSWVCPPFDFAGLDQIVLGEDVGIARDCWILTSGNRRDDHLPKMTIGAHSRVGRGSIIAAGLSVVLGESVLLAPRVYICDHTHLYQDAARPVMDQGDRTSPVSIGCGSWLGINVVVTPGVTIGRQCVIGANSVVTTSIPDYCVAAGAPARILKRYDPATARWEKIR